MSKYLPTYEQFEALTALLDAYFTTVPQDIRSEPIELIMFAEGVDEYSREEVDGYYSEYVDPDDYGTDDVIKFIKRLYAEKNAKSYDRSGLISEEYIKENDMDKINEEEKYYLEFSLTNSLKWSANEQDVVNEAGVNPDMLVFDYLPGKTAIEDRLWEITKQMGEDFNKGEVDPDTYGSYIYNTFYDITVHSKNPNGTGYRAAYPGEVETKFYAE